MLDDTAFRWRSRAVSTQGDEHVTLFLVHATPESRSSTGGGRGQSGHPSASSWGGLAMTRQTLRP
jgi:hypothetical protein